MWLKELTGFAEDSRTICSMLGCNQGKLFSKSNQRTFLSSKLITYNLAQLHSREAEMQERLAGQLQVSEFVADVQSLHKDPANPGAFLRVASHFILLEMVSPEVCPENGISGYQYDSTQGAACGVGIIYLNYVVAVNSQAGQIRNRQLNMLPDASLALVNAEQSLFQMKNGYALPSTYGLQAINAKLNNSSEQEFAVLQGQLRIGLYTINQVTLQDCTYLVIQAYCSACPSSVAAKPQKVGLLMYDSCWSQLTKPLLRKN